MDIIKRIHNQQLKIKHEKKMIPTDLGKKIIRNFKVPKRDHKHNLERYMKTTRRGNKLHKKGDVKHRRVRDYEDFIKNYNLVLKTDNNENNNINLKELKQYKEDIKVCKAIFTRIENTLNVNDLRKIQSSIKGLSKYKKFVLNLEKLLDVSTDSELLEKINNLRINNANNNDINNGKAMNVSQNSVNASSNNNNKNVDNNSNNDQHPKYNFGKV